MAGLGAAALACSSGASDAPEVIGGSDPVTASTSTTTGGAAFDLYVGTVAATDPTGTRTDATVTTPDGRTRRYRLYVPSSVRSDEAVPLLVALHGGVGSAAQFEANSGFSGLAESNRFLVVYPDGVGIRPDGTGVQTWNGGYCCGPAVRDDVDDVTFISAVIDAVEAQHPVDPSRVFAAGHSNGGIMSYRLACELSEQVVAVGVQSSSLGVNPCRPDQPVSVIHIHGLADTNHPIEGGVGGGGISEVAFAPAINGAGQLAEADGCSPLPEVLFDTSNPDLIVTTWAGCSASTEVQFIMVKGAGHAWMGHDPSSPQAAALVGEPYRGLDSSRAILSFLLAHPRP